MTSTDKSADPTSPERLESDLACLSPEQVDKLLEILRGLFRCVGDLNQRLAELEERHRF